MGCLLLRKCMKQNLIHKGSHQEERVWTAGLNEIKLLLFWLPVNQTDRPENCSSVVVFCVLEYNLKSMSSWQCHLQAGEHFPPLTQDNRCIHVVFFSVGFTQPSSDPTQSYTNVITNMPSVKEWFFIDFCCVSPPSYYNLLQSSAESIQAWWEMKELNWK